MENIAPETSRMSQYNNNSPSKNSEPGAANGQDMTMEQVRMLNPYQRTVRRSTRN